MTIIFAQFVLGNCAAADSDEIQITLGRNVLTEPLMEYRPPASKSKDKVNFQANGMLIQQYPDVKGLPSQGAGIMLLANCEGDFRCSLEFDCHKLEPPKSGWGQGLLIRILTEDPSMPIMSFGCIANKNHDKCCWIELRSSEGKPNKYFEAPTTYSSGAWIIERNQNQISLSLREKQGPETNIAKLACTPAKIKGVHLLCTRQASGNTSAEFLLKKITLSSSSFFAYAPPPPSLWRWSTVIWVVVLANAIMYLVYWWRNARSAARAKVR